MSTRNSPLLSVTFVVVRIQRVETLTVEFSVQRMELNWSCINAFDTDKHRLN
jgi:hypothetical protein